MKKKKKENGLKWGTPYSWCSKVIEETLRGDKITTME